MLFVQRIQKFAQPNAAPCRRLEKLPIGTALDDLALVEELPRHEVNSPYIFRHLLP